MRKSESHPDSMKLSTKNECVTTAVPQSLPDKVPNSTSPIMHIVRPSPELATRATLTQHNLKLLLRLEQSFFFFLQRLILWTQVWFGIAAKPMLVPLQLVYCVTPAQHRMCRCGLQREEGNLLTRRFHSACFSRSPLAFPILLDSTLHTIVGLPLLQISTLPFSLAIVKMTKRYRPNGERRSKKPLSFLL